MEPENSIQLIKVFWPAANELYSQAKNSHSANIALPAHNRLDAYQKFGQMFLRILFEGEQQFSQQYKGIISQISRELGLGKLPFDYILGFAIAESLKKSEDISKVVNLVRGRQEEYTTNTTNNTFDLQGSSDEEDTAIKTFLSQKNDSEDKEFSEKKDESDDLDDISINFGHSGSLEEECENDISLNIEDIQYNRDDFEEQNEEINQHMIKLSKATTELSYLCQHMRWSQPHSVENSSDLNPVLFKAHMEVLVRAKHGKGVIITGDCIAAVSKKQARRIASLFILRKIYHYIPEVWREFKQLCQEKSIEQPMNGNNAEIFKKAKLDVINISILQETPKEQEMDEADRQVNSYLDTLNSYKNDLNLFIGKNKKITPAEFKTSKQDDLGLWPTEATIYDQQAVIIKSAKDISKKKAEEKACRALLFELYRSNMARWQEFMAYKKNKF